MWCLKTANMFEMVRALGRIKGLINILTKYLAVSAYMK